MPAPNQLALERLGSSLTQTIAGGRGVSLFNSVGDAWTEDYLKIRGDLAVDLRSNIAAEARAKIVYERLISFTDEGEGLNVTLYDPKPNSEKTSKVDSTPVGDRKMMKSSDSTRKHKVA
jgi:hypothetical protein